jgi:DNA mismatch repair protein MutS
MSEHAASSVSKSPTDTPMMQQYFALKKQNPDHLLLFRIGGFYELFDEDARIAADRLGITLTKKNDILMCGFPHFALDTYLARLIVGGGHLVAVCEQTETPSDARRRGVGAIHREIRRIVSPGTLIEDSLLQPKSANYLLAVSIEAEQAGFACIDVSTGEMRVSVVNASQMGKF